MASDPTALTGSAKRVESVERALSLLDAFDENTPKLTLSQLASATGLYPSTTLRLAGTLEHSGYLRRNPNGEFRLGPAVLRLSSIYRGSFELGEIVKSTLKSLSDASGETAAFYVREGEERVCLYRHHSQRSVRHHIDEGKRLPLDRGAGGHVLLAHTGGDDEVHRQTLEDGYRISYGERDEESCAVAVPAWGHGGKLLGALAIIGPRNRMTDAKLQSCIDDLRSAAESLKKELGGG